MSSAGVKLSGFVPAGRFRSSDSLSEFSGEGEALGEVGNGRLRFRVGRENRTREVEGWEWVVVVDGARGRANVGMFSWSLRSRAVISRMAECGFSWNVQNLLYFSKTRKADVVDARLTRLRRNIEI